MKPPFDAAAFFAVFARYNAAVWPAQIALTALAIGAVVLAVRSRPWSDRAVCAVLALLWVWMGGVYHLGFFREINPAATLFGVLFLAEGFALSFDGVWRHKLRFRFRPTAAGILGALLIGFALVVYPILGYLFGHRYPAAPTFGLPCPTTIFTLGVLLWMEKPLPRAVFMIPLAWSALGTSAALRLGVREDLGLSMAGLIAALFLIVSALSSRLHHRPPLNRKPSRIRG